MILRKQVTFPLIKSWKHQLPDTNRTKLKNLFLLVVLFGLSACGEPILYFAGGRLGGDEAPLIDMPTSGGVLQIETLPDDPYSVNIGYVLLNGQIYIDPAEDRQWYQNILIDPRVRIRFEGRDEVHPMLSVRETNSATIAQFDPERIVLRLEQR